MAKLNTRPTIRVLIFDLFGVVISFDEDLVYRRLATHCREPEITFRSIRGLVSTPELITGKLTLPQLHERLVAEYGFALGLAHFESLWLMPYTAAIPGVAALLRELSSEFKLVLLSNVDRYYLEVVRKLHPELNCFSTQLVSCELGVAKPDKAAFQAAIEASRAQPAACYFIDDKPENVAAATALGLRGHVFSGVTQLRAALAEQHVSLAGSRLA